MNVFVTGGAGFVGSHVCDMLLACGYRVYSYDSLEMGVNFTPTGVEAWQGSLINIKKLPPDTDCVVHCAARADVQSNWKDAKERTLLRRSNIDGTMALLEASLGKPVVFLSTCAVYGDNADCQEDSACVATSPYAASKLAGEALVQSYAYAFKMPWHVFRLGCVVGDRYHHGHIRDFVDMATHNQGRIEPQNDGLTKKSFVHVLDVAAAVRDAVRGAIGPGVYNCTSGNWSPRDTVRVMGPSAEAIWPENKKHGWIGDPMAVATGMRLRNAGWTPLHSIESGVRAALQYLGWKP